MNNSIIVHENVQRTGRSIVPFRLFIEVHWASNRPMPPDNQILGTVAAYVNHGRWVADCPTPGCYSAMIVSELDPMFACVNCGNGWWTVAFPSNRKSVEKVLLKRPWEQTGRTRNWIPGETVADLEKENAERGI